MQHLTVRQIGVIVVHALVIWAVCGAVMFAGMALLPMQTALIIHAVAAPVVAGLAAWFYFEHFGYTAPRITAVLFTVIVILLDVFVVALLVQRSFAMFASVLGTWIPFALIFTATYLAGRRAAGIYLVGTG